jgi:alcohol dehydrogenase class IV
MNTNDSLPWGDWTYPTQFRFGVGRIRELGEACRSLSIARPLLVTDFGLARSDMVRAACARLTDEGIEAALFCELRPDPVGRNVEDGVAAYLRGGHDGVIAFGGGSAMDAGKAVALMIDQDRPIWDFDDVTDHWTQAKAEAIAPVIAVPTTAGTGSETGRAVAIVNEATRTKVIVFHPRMLPRVVIADPELTMGLPPHLTAATGLDALSHCFEAYCAPGYHPIADGIALEGMRLIKDWLPVAVRDGADLCARSHMMAAASMGAAAFQKGLGAIHALSHQINALFGTHHGLTNAVLMPYVMVFNRPAIEAEMRRLAAYLSLGEASFAAVLDWVLALRRELAIPNTIEVLGVTTDALDEIAARAAIDPTAPTNPIPAGAAEMRRMVQAAMDGVMD